MRLLCWGYFSQCNLLTGIPVFDAWTQAMFAQGDWPYALATFELPDRAEICDLDNAGSLLAHDLRPSGVVARERGVTQAWAARIHRTKKWIGIAWWRATIRAGVAWGYGTANCCGSRETRRYSPWSTRSCKRRPHCCRATSRRGQVRSCARSRSPRSGTVPASRRRCFRRS